jgi:fibronectin type 3 domain-containing protein
VYYGTSSNSIDSLADTVTGASYTHTGLTAGTTYYYYIKAVNSAGESDYSSPASATTSGSSGGGTTAPNAPYGIMIRSANTTSSSLQIVWDASLNATSYKLYRSTSSSGTFTVVYSGSATEYTNTGLSSGTTYYYKATAVNSAGESNYTSTVSGTTSGSSGGGATTPGTPTGVTATAQSSSSIRVSWSAVSGATSYKVYYEIGSSPTKNLASGTVTGTSYTHTGLTASTTYYYYIKAVNSAGESDYSFLAVATTSGSSSSTPTKLATPTNLQEYSGDSFVQISWTEVSLAYTYKVYRSTSANGTYSEITVSIGTSGSTVIATDSSPRTGTSYYKVRAIPLSSLSNVTQSDLSAYVRVTR